VIQRAGKGQRAAGVDHARSGRFTKPQDEPHTSQPHKR
jgi:hypothetical protein